MIDFEFEFQYAQAKLPITKIAVPEKEPLPKTAPTVLAVSDVRYTYGRKAGDKQRFHPATKLLYWLALINVVIFFASSVLYATPITIILMPVFFALLEGVVYFIIGTKVKKPGAILI